MAALPAKGSPLETGLKDGTAPLAMAAQHGKADIVDTLLAAGAAIDAQNSFGTSALMFAAQSGHAAIVETLLAKGADPTLSLKNGTTAHGLTKDAKIKEMLTAASE